MEKDAYIRETIHRLYYEDDINCARTMLTCLSGLFGVAIEPQTMHAAIGMHGAGLFRAQCGLVEGSLMFIGLYFAERGKSDEEISNICYRFAESFTKEFSSLTCRELRPDGFSDDDPPHACEELTCGAAAFAYEFLKKEE